MRGKGFTLIELMIVITLIAIIVAIAIPSLLESRKRANESAAVASLHKIATAETRYRELYSQPATAPNPDAPTYAFIADNGNSMPPFQPRSLITVGLLDGFQPDPLANPLVTRQGYRFYGRQSANNSLWSYAWLACAWPMMSGTTGDMRFATNHTGVIYWRPDAATTFFANFDITGLDFDGCTVGAPYAPIGR